MRGLHIVIVPSWWPSPEQPTAGIFCTDYARAFAAAGARVGVVVPDLVGLRGVLGGAAPPVRAKVTEESLDGIPIVRVRGLFSAFGQPRLQMGRFASWLERGLKAYRNRHGTPDVLHAMCAIPAGWACTQLDDPSASRVVVTEHTGPFSLVMKSKASSALAREGLASAAAVVAVSEQSRREMVACGIDREILVRGNCVAAEFAARSVRSERRDGPVRGLFVGRLCEEKGVGELIAALRFLGANVDVQWHFVGDGPMAGDVRLLSREAAFESRVHLHGECPRSTVVEIMAESDLLVLPSHGETFGLAVAEALCMGLPVVTCCGTACAEFVTDDNGLLCEPSDVESLSGALRDVIGRVGAYDRGAIAEATRARFSPNSWATWYGELFRRVVGEL